MHYLSDPQWGGMIAGVLPPYLIPFITLIVIWSLFWQALGMWHSARRRQWIWFLVFFLVHTLGILEIIYLFWIAKVKPSELLHWSEPNLF